MKDIISTHDQIDHAIGRVCTRWAYLESSVINLITVLAMYRDPAFEQQEPLDVLTTITVNLKIRAAVACAKALAHNISDPPDFYDRAAAILNPIVNKLRCERNRHVHDEWTAKSPTEIERAKFGSVVRRAPSTGKRQLEHSTRNTFGSVNEITSLAEQIEKADSDVRELVNELETTLDRIRPLGE